MRQPRVGQRPDGVLLERIDVRARVIRPLRDVTAQYAAHPLRKRTNVDEVGHVCGSRLAILDYEPCRR